MVNRACIEHDSALLKNQPPCWASNQRSIVNQPWQRMLALSLMLLGITLLSGCGGDEDEGKSLVPPAQQSATDGTDANPVAPPMDPTEVSPNVEDPMPMEEEKEPIEPEEPPRPDSVEKWKTDDYLSAKRDGDRRLQEAVDYMGEKFAGDARAASLFKKLIIIERKPGKKLPDGTQGPEIEISVTLPITDALLRALGKNKTPESTAILKDILIGKIETPAFGPRAAYIVQDILTNNLDFKPYEDFVFNLATHPEEILEGVSDSPNDPLSPRRFQSNLLSTLAQHSSVAMNLRLAKYLNDPRVSKELATQIELLLIPDRPESLQAKLVLYRNKQTELRTRNSVESTINAHCETALKMLLGIPPKLESLPTPGTLSRPVRPQKPYSKEAIQNETSFATMCWTPEFVAYMNGQVEKSNSPDQLTGVIQFLNSIPTNLGRFSMSELISYHGYRGPRFWSSSGLFARVTTDPGLLVMTKQIYHGSVRRASRVDKNDPRPQVDQAARDQWRDGIEPLVRSWVAKMYSAAKNSDQKVQAAAREKGNFRVNLHRNAHVVAEYHLVWPGEAQSKIPEVALAPVEIHYIRIEEEAASPDKMTSYYKRYGGGISSPKHEDVRNGFWYDDLANGSTPRSKVSIDILMEHKPIAEDPKANGINNDPKPIPLSIDILTIEIPEVVEPEGS